MRAPRKRSIAAWLWTAVSSALLASSCVVAPDEVHGPCSVDSDCPDDDNPCTKSVCEANGFCASKPQALSAGDAGCDDSNPCTDDACGDGACQHTPGSTTPDDGNPCTEDSCAGGAPHYTAVPDNTACGKDDQLKCIGGKCNCQSADECGVSTECLKFACENNECSSVTSPAGAPVDNLSEGDCLKRACDGANNVVTVPDTGDPPPDVAGDCRKKECSADGTVIDVTDDTDKPADDNNECTIEACKSGTPVSQMPVTDGTACGGVQETCDLAPGGGYQYTAGSTCKGGACAAASPVSCGFYKCDGTKCKVACASDVECVTGTFCDLMSNTCKPVADIGSACSNDGQCSTAHCVDGVCCATACDGLCQQCNGFGAQGLCMSVIPGTDPNNDCAGVLVCSNQGACVSPQGSPCAMDSACQSGICTDGVCCDSPCAGACMRCDVAGQQGTCALVPAGMMVTDCTGTQACDGAGGCKLALAAPCAQNADCLSGSCADGVCCNNACNGACARCDIAGSVGTCSNVPAGQQVSGCNTNNACDGNSVCKKLNGQTCIGVNDCLSGFCPSEHGLGNRYCCDTACTATCESCAGSKTTSGINGVCDNIKDKTDPDDECVGGCNVANGSGCCVISGGNAVCM